MTDRDTNFLGEIPQIYDRYLVPLIFETYAEDLARRTAAGAARDVLETAAGSGVLTRALTRTLAADARITATDLNEPMLETARTRQPDARGVTWRQADALALPFDDDSFDAVTCQFGAMFFPDRAAGYAEARRVLRPGGRLLFNVWDRIEDNVFADIVTRAAAEIFPDDPPVFLARTPHGYFDTRTIAEDLAAAGFRSSVFEYVTRMSEAPSARDVAIAYCQGTPLRAEIEARDPARLADVTDHATHRLEQIYGPEGPISGQIKAIVVVAAS